MCGIVGYVGTKDCAPILVEGLRRLEYRGYDSAGLARPRALGRERSRSCAPSASSPTSRRALNKSPLNRHDRASATRAGRRTDGRARRTRTPTSPGRSPSCTTGSSRTTWPCAASSRRKGVRFASDTDTEIVAHLVDEALRAGSASLGGGSTRRAEARTRRVRHRGPQRRLPRGDRRRQEPTARSSSESATARCSARATSRRSSRTPATSSSCTTARWLRSPAAASTITTLDGARVERAPKTHRLVAHPGREGRLQALHAQGDPRAAARRRGHAARSRGSRRGGRRRRGDRHRRRGGEDHRSRLLRRLRDELSRGDGGALLDRAARWHSGRRRDRERGALPRPRVRPWRSRRRRQPERRDGRHPRGSEDREGEGRSRARRRQRHRQRDPAGKRRRALHARRPRDWRRFDEVLHDAARRHAPSRGLPGSPAREAHAGGRRGASSKRSLVAPSRCATCCPKPTSLRLLAKKYLRAQHMLFLGRGTGFPIALEGALKLKEISYIHAEGYAAGEMKHGPIALIDEEMPVVAIVPRDAHYEKTLSNMQEVRAREGRIIAVCTEGDRDVRSMLGAAFERLRDPRRRLRGAAAAHGPAAAAARLLHGRPQGDRRRPAPQPREDRNRRVRYTRHRDGIRDRGRVDASAR